MVTELDAKHARYGSARSAFMHDLSALTPDAQTKRPAESAWSALEIAEHVLLVERPVLESLERSSSELRSAERSTFGDRVRSRLLTLLMRSPLRFKAPVKDIVPSGAYGGEDLLREWSGLAARWSAVLERFGEADLERRVFRHPVMQWMTVGQTLDFLTEHLERHRAQLLRTTSKRSQLSDNNHPNVGTAV